MNRRVLVALLVAGALALLTFGVVLAQTEEPPVPRGRSGMAPGWGFGPMHFFGAGGQAGRMHEYMESAIADALGISLEEFESRREAGESAYQIALAEGFTPDEIPTLLRDARLKALDSAAADGVVSQEQAEWMKSRPFGTGLGMCGGTGQAAGPGMMGGWRFRQSNP